MIELLGSKLRLRLLFAKSLAHTARKHYEFHGAKAIGMYGPETGSILDCSKWAHLNVESMVMAQVHGSRRGQQNDISWPAEETGVLGLANRNGKVENGRAYWLSGRNQGPYGLDPKAT
jgi:hypothetical protein